MVVEKLGLSSPVLLSAVARAIRYKSGTGPHTNLHRAFRFYPAAIELLNMLQQSLQQS